MNELAVISPKAPLSNRRWSERFAMDFAMTLLGSGSKPSELLKEYEFEPSDLETFSAEPMFLQRVEIGRAHV